MSTLFFPNHFSSENQTLTRPSNKCSPIYTLPNELLEEIFYTTIPAWHLNTDRSEDFDEGGRVRLRATVILASVSYRWHELVHGCPRMWATLHGGLDLNDIKFLLSKSKNAPLFIACGLLSDFLAELIKPHIHRWSSFNVHTSKLEISSMKSLLTESLLPSSNRSGWWKPHSTSAKRQPSYSQAMHHDSSIL
ncbi:hypothetical protein FRC03_012808 [Tulasnella sp. 419]|nr:hypothetical protein FRC03_012808 [Tulasnella sp. 419]